MPATTGVPCHMQPFDAAAMAAQGYTQLATHVAIGDELCDIYSRVRDDNAGWLYQVVCEVGHRDMVLDPDNPFRDAPGVAALAERLIMAGLLDRRPPLSYEWAINVNYSNDFTSNFPCEELRDRAIDELFIEGDIEHDDEVSTFEIYPNGRTTDTHYVDNANWPRERGIESMIAARSDAERSEAMRPT